MRMFERPKPNSMLTCGTSVARASGPTTDAGDQAKVRLQKAFYGPRHGLLLAGCCSAPRLARPKAAYLNQRIGLGFRVQGFRFGVGRLLQRKILQRIGCEI